LTDLGDVPKGTLVFVDSNIFTYFLLGGSRHFEVCKEFLKRVERGDIQGIINEIVIAETWYNYVKYKIIEDHKIALKDFYLFIKKKPAVLAKADVSEVAEIFSIPNLHLVAPPQSFIMESLGSGASLPLLSNDAFHVITMRYANLDNIATNDPDFDAIEEISVWKP